MIVGDIMSKNPAHIGPTASIFSALNLLKDLDVRHLLIMENGELVGILSDRDIRALSAADREAAKIASTNFDLSQALKRPVSEFMSTDVFYVEPETLIQEAIDIMLDQNVGAIPVVNADNSLVGIVSYVDILKAASSILNAAT